MRHALVAFSIVTAAFGGACGHHQLNRTQHILGGAAGLAAGVALTSVAPPRSLDAPAGCDCPGNLLAALTWFGPLLAVGGGIDLAYGLTVSDAEIDRANEKKAERDQAEREQREEKERVEQVAKAERERVATAKRQRDAEIMAEFHDAQTTLAAGNCTAAAELADDIRARAPDLADATVGADYALVRCIDKRNTIAKLEYDVETAPLPDVPTDEQTLRYAQQVRSAAADHDCRTVDRLMGEIAKHDLRYHEALAGSHAVGECQ